MTFSVIWSDNARRQLSKLDRSISKRIVLSVEKLGENPYRHIKKVAGDESFRLRVGDYRIFLDINNQQLNVLVLKVDRRSTAYRNL